MCDLTYIALGAGVQSTAMLVASVRGLRGVPKADCAIFADTGDEPQAIYEHLKYLRQWSPIPIHTVTAGHLSQDVIDRHRGRKRRCAAIPVHTTTSDGGAMMRRQCTREYKIEPIHRKVRNLLGYAKGQHVQKQAVALVGISLDEAHRMAPSRIKWIENQYPLVDARMHRSACAKLLEDGGVPVPPKSSCIFCPYHSDRNWAEMQQRRPDDWERCVVVDEAIRDMSMSGIAQPVYLHRSCKPLAQVRFNDQPELFGNECGGYCGV